MRKELLWPYVREFADRGTAYATSMLAAMAEGGRRCQLYVVHGHYAGGGWWVGGIFVCVCGGVWPPRAPASKQPAPPPCPPKSNLTCDPTPTHKMYIQPPDAGEAAVLMASTLAVDMCMTGHRRGGTCRAAHAPSHGVSPCC